MRELIPYEKKNSFHFSICCGIRSLAQFVAVLIRYIPQFVVVFPLKEARVKQWTESCTKTLWAKEEIERRQ